ncbi:hypothetical protein UFOVP1634_11 [uncultured Caudovirales phage]|uniref:Uncharacterized protein n=1 Tax=uncultured Caudovirales phage TaxID=2100421 RepID=A0A6J5SZ98_9CAUD|nr:hypothetical protein UFOVP1634_11 [uncultured Caudovirales phage]
MKGSNNNILLRLNQIEKNTKPLELARVAYPVFKKYTPKRSGNAQHKTLSKGDTIHANYPYAKRLDNGYSKQHGGVGMTEPTLQAIKEYLDKKA